MPTKLQRGELKVSVALDIESRIAKLGSSIKAIRKALPETKTFPEELKREAAQLVQLGVPPEKIARSCGLVPQTIYKWENRYPEQNRIPTARKLEVISERQSQFSARSSQSERRCEIDLGCAVTLRIPMDELTRDLLCVLREVFPRC